MGKAIRSVYQPIAAFGGWWIGELAGLIPQSLRKAWRPAAPTVEVRVGDDSLVLATRNGDGLDEISEIDLACSDTESVRHRVDAFLSEHGAGKSGPVMCIPVEETLRRTLELPQAAEMELESALALQMDRLSPFNRSEIYFDYRIVGRSLERQKLTVDIVIAPRTRIAQALGTAERWGVFPAVIDVVEPGSMDREGFDLLRRARNTEPQKSPLRFNRWLACLALALAVAAVYVAIDRRAAALVELEAQVATARAEANTAAKLQKSIDRFAADIRFLADRKTNSPSALRTLEELTQVLPDHTWISEFAMTGSGLQISGYSKAASSLIGLLDQSRYFRKPAFRSPVTQEPKTGIDRFGISMEAENLGIQ